jgi:hypothetical protein
MTSGPRATRAVLCLVLRDGRYVAVARGELPVVRRDAVARLREIFAAGQRVRGILLDGAAEGAGKAHGQWVAVDPSTVVGAGIYGGPDGERRFVEAVELDGRPPLEVMSEEDFVALEARQQEWHVD